MSLGGSIERRKETFPSRQTNHLERAPVRSKSKESEFPKEAANGASDKRFSPKEPHQRNKGPGTGRSPVIPISSPGHDAPANFITLARLHSATSTAPSLHHKMRCGRQHSPKWTPPEGATGEPGIRMAKLEGTNGM